MSTSITVFEGRHYRTGRGVKVELAGGRIAAVREAAGRESTDSPWIGPGFIDLQSNGYGGQEFSSPELSVERVAEIARMQGMFGVARFLPTVTTAGRDTIEHSLRTITEACKRLADVAYTIAGIHLEGPYITSEEGPRGAHPAEHCRPPDWHEFEQFQSAAGGMIRLLTLSPEYAGSPDFIRRAADRGIVVAIGHTKADSAQIRAAVDAGARLSTHLGNGAHRTLRRHPNYLWDQLAEDRLMASLIVDGHHLPSEVVKTFVRAKTPERCLLISDLSGMAGLPAGLYHTQLCDLEILADGRLVIAGQEQLLAGASLGIEAGVANVMRFAGVDLATACDMASNSPALLLGLPPNQVRPGDPADLVVFDWQPDSPTGSVRFQVLATVADGTVRFRSA